jgi:hypothetical protein
MYLHTFTFYTGGTFDDALAMAEHSRSQPNCIASRAYPSTGHGRAAVPERVVSVWEGDPPTTDNTMRLDPHRNHTDWRIVRQLRG